MRMATPEMKVVHFNENDIIVASGDTLSLSKFGDGHSKNGVVNYKNQAFTLTDRSAVNTVLAALNADGYSGSTLVDNGTYNTSVTNLFNIEANVKLRIFASGWIISPEAMWSTAISRLSISAIR